MNAPRRRDRDAAQGEDHGGPAPTARWWPSEDATPEPHRREPEIADTATAHAAAADRAAVGRRRRGPTPSRRTRSRRTRLPPDNKLKPAFQSPGAEEAVAVKPVKTKKSRERSFPRPARWRRHSRPRSRSTWSARSSPSNWHQPMSSPPRLPRCVVGSDRLAAERGKSSKVELPGSTPRRYAGVIGGRRRQHRQGRNHRQGYLLARARAGHQSRDDAIKPLQTTTRPPAASASSRRKFC